MTRVIGVDPSITATGIADVNGHLTVAGGPPYMGDRRLPVIGQAVADVVERGLPDLAVIEDLPQHAKAAGITGMVQGVIRSKLIELGVPYAIVVPATLKKFASGRGDADKADLRMALYKRTGIDERSDDKVDAWWLRAAGLQHLGEPIVTLPAAQVKVLEIVGWPDAGGEA